MPANKVLAVEFGAKPELKKYMKKVMPFVQLAKRKLAEPGKKLTMDDEFFPIDEFKIDEFKILKDNIGYITSTLNVTSF